MARAHGTRSCFVGGCRCAPCVEASRTYLAAYYQLTKPYLGGIPNVDATRARAHIERLRSEGVGIDTIALDAGLQKNTLWNIVRGVRTRGIRPDTERRILAVRARPQWVNSTGTMRRLRALAALGHTFGKVAAEVGMHQRTISKIACGRHDEVRVRTADQITHLYDQWSMMTGPSSRVRGYAIAKGWVPPLAWDDDMIDDPAAVPVAAEDPSRSQLDLEEWWMLVQAGENPQRASNRCGVLVGTVERAAQRAGRKDIAAAAAAARHQARWGTAA